MPQGKYVSRASDVPRKSFDGEDPGLLVEAAGRTNHVPRSSSITSSDWDSTAGIASESTSTSVIDGEDANKVTGDGVDICFLIKNCGSFSGNTEVAHCIVERGTADSFYIEIKNSTSGNKVFQISYDWVNDTTNISQGNAQEVNVRTLQASGPNNNKLIQLIARYAGDNSENVTGQGRQISLIPDFNKNNASNILHHAQREKAPNASSPIVTQGSPVTRSADDYAIFEGGQPPWWNPNEGTIFGAVLFPAYKQPDFVTHLKIAGVAILQTRRGEIFFNHGDIGFSSLARSYTPFTKIKFAVTLEKDSMVFSTNGSSQSDTGVDPSGASSMLINEGISRWQKLIYYPRALPESTLNRITS